MRLTFALLLSLLFAGSAFGQGDPGPLPEKPAKPPTADDFFASMKGQFDGTADRQSDPTPLYALLLAACSAGVAVFTIRKWNERSPMRPGGPKPPVKSQKKLLAEAARKAGVSKAQMKQLEALTRAEGLSSPLVAIICPSVLKKLASEAQSDKQKHAITALARQMAKK